MATQVRDDLVPDYGTSDADKAFEGWFESTFNEQGAQGEDSGVERARADAPAEDYHPDSTDAGEDSELDDYFFDDDGEVDYSDLPPTWFDRNKWRVLAGAAGVFVTVLVFSLLGGFGGEDDSQARERGDVVAPQELSADEIAKRPTATAEVGDRPVLRNRATETTSTRPSSVAPRDIQRGGDGSPYSRSGTNRGTDAGTAAEPQTAQQTAQQPAQQTAQQSPATPAPQPAPAVAVPAQPATPQGAETPAVETVYQTPDR